ncbi:MAG: GIY-YIG nuclease family protein [Candidatus Portnoybacteria bacterium]|nr:GIY-YIG nuclease family protein [Candidatus Portnoybacteria bacterium]
MKNNPIGKLKKLPQKPGVYTLKDKAGRLIYIGKAINLRNRVRSHFSRTSIFYKNDLANIVADIDWIETKNEKQALLLENELIKKYQPRYNIQWRDDKSYFWVRFTNDEWPRVIVAHKGSLINSPQPSPVSSTGRALKGGSDSPPLGGVRGDFIGPFVSGRELRKTLRALRKIFPFRTCKNSYDKPCLQWHLGLCPAHKPHYHSRESGNLEDKKSGFRVKPGMTKESQIDKYLNSLVALSQFLRLYAGEKIRIEAYDISNIQGNYATGSMIVFYGNKPSKSDYRRFKIKTIKGANDVAMIKEVLKRRLGHPEWPYPDLILIDGGLAQLNAAVSSISKQLPSTAIIALAKQQEEIYTEYSSKPLKVNPLPESFRLTFQHIRDEAHRFAIFYYRYLHATRDFRRTRKKVTKTRFGAAKEKET